MTDALRKNDSELFSSMPRVDEDGGDDSASLPGGIDEDDDMDGAVKHPPRPMSPIVRVLLQVGLGAAMLSCLVGSGILDLERVGGDDDPLRHRRGISILFTEPAYEPPERIGYLWVLLLLLPSHHLVARWGSPWRRHVKNVLAYAAVVVLVFCFTRRARTVPVLFPVSAGSPSPQWCQVPPSRLRHIRANLVIMNDGQCAAVSRMGDVRRWELDMKVGGEALFCENVIRLASDAGYTVAVAEDIPTFVSAVEALHPSRASVVVHNGMEHVVGEAALGPSFMDLPPPFDERCFAQMGFWGPRTFRLPSRDRYVSPFPMDGVTYAGVRADLCPRTEGMRPPLRQADADLLRASPYAVLYGKFDKMRDSSSIQGWMRDSALWDQLLSRVRIIVPHCAPLLSVGIAHCLDSFVCLDRGSDLRGPNWADLLLGAEFVLGAGNPVQSPAPIEALSCNTTVVLPRGQHSFLEQYALAPAFYAVSSPGELIQVVDDILRPGKQDVHAAASRAIAAIDPAGNASLRKRWATLLGAMSASCGQERVAEGDHTTCAQLSDAGWLDHVLLVMGIDLGAPFSWVLLAAIVLASIALAVRERARRMGVSVRQLVARPLAGNTGDAAPPRHEA